ncbi:putative synaptobrevin-like YKT6 [Apostichopus japonicus]|uniref:Putative synaptobrevin-like YKT6 n=1 Tax=Stichopus japonicus TaxID=307972 RepID=A0A2G8LDB9_STIJA|nr:putative synaptobrevin-like YKT6 [Apostichopus japonicus]
MKLHAICILYKGGTKVQTLKSAYDLSSFGYFQKSSAQEFMKFTSQIVVERTQPGLRQSVKEKDYICHVYVRSDSLGGVAICDHEYPPRVAFTFMNKLLDQFANEVPSGTWPSIPEDGAKFTGASHFLTEYQDPSKADAMTRLQKDLDETKVIMHGTIESMLERGEKLDDLVEKSDALSSQSKAFYKTAKKTNSCCVIQ